MSVIAPPLSQLTAIVSALARARRRQLVVEEAFVGLFAGTLAAAVAVLALRAGGSSLDPWLAAAGCVALGTAAAVVHARRRRPSDLAVAIRVDREYKLKERISTAAEFAGSSLDPAMQERLAAQALRARLPGRAERVFPVRFNLWARLIPLAAALVVLAAIIDLEHFAPGPAQGTDPLVAHEGARIESYANALQARAAREGLERSESAARRMHGLGERMRTGAISRREALARLYDLSAALREQRGQALADWEGRETEVGPVSPRPMRYSESPGAAALRDALARLLDGRGDVGDARALGDPAALSELGLSREQLEQALAGLDAGDREKLRELMKSLPRSNRSLRDADELGGARAEVNRSRSRLGAPSAADGAGEGDAPAAPQSGGQQSQDSPSDEFGGDDAMDDGRGSLAPAPGMGSGGGSSERRARDRELPAPARSGVVLRPDSQLLQGGVFASQGRVLPAPGEVRTGRVELAPRFETQMEEVMSKESYPPHHKALIRRYFLGLSEAQPAAGGEVVQP